MHDYKLKKRKLKTNEKNHTNDGCGDSRFMDLQGQCEGDAKYY